MRHNSWGRYEGITSEHGYYIFIDMETEKPCCSPFAVDHAFGSAYTENGVMYVNGVRGNGGGQIIDFFESRDLENWEMTGSIDVSDEQLRIYNTSCCKDDEGYLLAIEMGGSNPNVGKSFTNFFARSKDMRNWSILPMDKNVFSPERYTACPVIRYYDGYYYIIHLESLPYYRWLPYIVRSKDLVEFEPGLVNPIMCCDNDDKKIHPLVSFNEKDLDYIMGSVDSNNSDIDLCEYNGKTVIMYSWGNQLGKEFLAVAEYDGSEEEFLKSFF
jgi:alpha-L-fucosidase